MKPQPVGGDLASRSVETVAAGEYFTLVTTDSGEIYGWGSDANGQLGVQADSSNTFHSPVQVNVGPKVGTALAVAAGYQHSVAIVQQKE
jgi:alpha-tubulin suppressor-like RCC1 family protein